MFSKKPVPQIENPNTVLGKGISLEAVNLTGSESVRIDGFFKGIIDIDGSLILADTGSIVGNISAKQVLIAGRVEGNITSDSVVHFASTARVTGEIAATSLIVDEGGVLNGRYQIGSLPNDARLSNVYD